MPSSSYTVPAMDLENMRSLGVRAVAVECACDRREAVDMSGHYLGQAQQG